MKTKRAPLLHVPIPSDQKVRPVCQEHSYIDYRTNILLVKQGIFLRVVLDDFLHLHLYEMGSVPKGVNNSESRSRARGELDQVVGWPLYFRYGKVEPERMKQLEADQVLAECEAEDAFLPSMSYPFQNPCVVI